MGASEFTKSMQLLGTRYMDEYTRSMQRYADLMNNVANSSNKSAGSDVIGSAEQQNRYTEFVLEEAPKVLGRLAEANLDYYNAITDLGVHTLNRYFDQVLQAQSTRSVPQSGAQSVAPTACPTAAATLFFHGMRGQATNNAFLVSNNRNVEMDVAFDVTEVVNDDATSRFKPKAGFTPERCQLAPNNESVVQCSIFLSDDFQVGQKYRGSISVVGFPEMAMPFSIEVEEPVKPKKPDNARKKTPVRKVTKRRQQKTKPA